MTQDLIETGQIWRKKGIWGAVRLDAHEAAHGAVGEGWYVTVGKIDPKRRRFRANRRMYVPGADPVGKYRRLTTDFTNPWAINVSEEWENTTT